MKQRQTPIVPCRAGGRGATCGVLAILFGVAASGVSLGWSGEVVRPLSAGELAACVERTLAQQPDYQPGDLITRTQVSRCLAALAQLGWGLQDPQTLLARTLADDDFLVGQLTDAQGRRFMDKIRQTPGGLDRVDRLASMPQGHANVHDLIHKVPNGYEWINAMGSTPNGKRLAKSLENSAKGRNFTQPTGRIYTAETLVKYLDGKLVPKPMPRPDKSLPSAASTGRPSAAGR